MFRTFVHNKISITISILILIGLLSATSVSTAQTNFNQQVNYQGKLTTSTGAAVADGTYNMRFWLLTSPSIATTSAVWTESYTGSARVSVQNGLFSVMLGSSTPLTGVNFNQALYLGVEIGATSSTPVWDGEMSPRKVLGAVPAAFEAKNAETVGGVASSSFLRNDQPGTLASNTAQTLFTITQNGAGDILNVFDTSTEVFTILDGGNIGIGSSSPSRTLTVAGTFFASGTSTLATTTLASTTVTSLTLNGDFITDFTGTGLSVAGGFLSVATTSLTNLDATTFNGQGPAFYLSRANHTGTQATSTITGVFTPVNGGTGLSTITQNQLLIGGAGNTWSQIATSSLGLSAAFTTLTQLDTILTDVSGITGTGSFVLSASPTFTGTTNFANLIGTNATMTSATTTNLAISSLTSGRVPFVTTGGLLADTATFVFTGTRLGIGTTTPGRLVHLEAASADAGVRTINTTNNVITELRSDTSQGFVGTVSNHDLRLFTNGLSRVTITSGGNFGIGTTTPGATLSVAGNSYLGGTVVATGTVSFLGTLGVAGTSTLATTTIASSTIGTLNLTNALSITNGGTGAVDAAGARTNLGATTVGSNIFTLANPSVMTLIRINADNTVSTVATSTLGVNLGDTTGILDATRGGTGLSSYATGDLIYASGANTLANRTIGSTGQILMVSGGLPTWTSTSSLGLRESLFTDGGASTYLTSLSDRLGIGTTTANATLDVWGDFLVGASSTPTLYASSTASFVGIGASTPAGTEKLRVTGNVAIGNGYISNDGDTASGLSLDTAGRGRFTSLSGAETSFWLRNDSTGGSSSASVVFEAGTAGTDVSKIESVLVGSVSNSDLTFETTNSGTLDERVRIKGNGDFGIGTSTPASKLAVAGGAYIGGNITGTGTLSIAGTSTLATTTVTDLTISAALRDAFGSSGTDGFVLLTSGTSTRWVATSTLGLGSTFGNTINANELAAEDFGSFTCNGTTCTVDNNAVTAAMITDGDHGFFSYSGNTASLDTNGLSSGDLIAAVTNETGTGSLVFSNAPAFGGVASFNAASTTNISATGTANFATATANNLTLTTALAPTSGGTGNNTYAVGDILYASGAGTLTRLAAGSDGTVLKISSGIPSWGADIANSGAGAWATSSNNLFIYPSDPNDVVVIGASATTTTGFDLEVVGDALVQGIRATSATTTNFTINSERFTDLTGDGLVLNGTALDVDCSVLEGLGITCASNNFALDFTEFTSDDIVEGSTNFWGKWQESFGKLSYAPVGTPFVGVGDTDADYTFEVASSTGTGYFAVSSNADGDGDVFEIDPTGNVGIGDNSPDYKLDVNGTLRATGLATFDNGIAVSGNSTFGGLTISNATITNATATNLSLVNALGATSGGTGLSTITQNQLLIGGAGNTWSQIATSSLGLSAAFTTLTQLDTILTDVSGITGTGSFVLSASPTFTGTTNFANLIGTNATITNATTTQLVVSSLTSGRVPFVTTGGRLTDQSTFTFNGTTLAAPNMSLTGILGVAGTSTLATTTATALTASNSFVAPGFSANSTFGVTVTNSVNMSFNDINNVGDLLVNSGNLTVTGTSTLATTTIASSTIGTLNLTNALTGVNGGTGLSTITQNQLLIGGAGNTWSQVATSSLGLSAAFSTSAQLAALLSDETGTGQSVFNVSPAFGGTATFGALSATSTLTLSGTAANIALGSNWLSGDGDDEGITIDSTGRAFINNATSYAADQLLSITNQGGYTTVGIAAHGAVSYEGAAISARRARGNISSPTVVQNGDLIFQLNAVARGNSAWTGIADFTIDVDGTVSGNNVPSRFTFFTTNSSGVQSEVMRINSVGNLGLGTTSPNQALSIFRNAADAAIEFSTLSGANEKWTLGIDDSDGAKFKISSSSALGTNDRFVIDGSGNVGIGTTTPGARLVVNGSVKVGGNASAPANYDSLIVGERPQADDVASLKIGPSTVLDRGWKLAVHDDGTASHYFSIWDEVASSERLRIDSSGNVGIGTTTPGAKFAVQGSGYFGGNLTATGTLTVSGLATLANATATNLTVTGRLYDNANSAGSNGMVLQSTGSGFQWVATSSLGISGGSSLFTDGGATTYLTSLSDNFSIGTTSSQGLVTVATSSSATALAVSQFGSGDLLNLFDGNTEVLTVVDGGNVGIGTSSPLARLALQKTSITGSQVAGIDSYYGVTNSTLNAIIYGEAANINFAPTATTTLVGNIIRIADNTTLGNNVQGFQVQTNRGSNTFGENTAIAGFGRTFGVRGTTEGDAGGLFEPAGVFAETRGTTQGNALRAFSDDITTADLVSFDQDTSAFSGNGLVMDFGTGGSFTGNFLKLRNAGADRLTITSTGAFISSSTLSVAGTSTLATTTIASSTITTLNVPNLIGTNATITNATTTQLVVSSLTSGRVAFATTSGRLVDSSLFTFNGTTLAAPNLSLTGTLGVTGTSTLATTTVTDLTISRGLRDTTSSLGTLGMVLQSTGTSTRWVATSTLGITGSGGSLFTDGGATTYLTSLTDNLAIGTSTAFTSSRLLVDGSVSINKGSAYTIGDVVAFKIYPSQFFDYTNLFIGTDSPTVSTTVAFSNTIVGRQAGDAITTGYGNTALGTFALGNAQSTVGNVAIGSGTLGSAISGVDGNVIVGNDAGSVLTSATNNTFIGTNAGLRLATSSQSVIVGALAVGNGYGPVQANSLAVFGYGAGYNLQSGAHFNTFIGPYAGENVTTGAGNTLLGYRVGDSLTTGANNIALGYDIELASSTLNNQLNIGNLIFGTSLDGTGTTLSSGNIGIGTTSPASKLDVWGSFRVGTSSTPTLYATTSSGRVGIGTTTPQARLSIGLTNLIGTGVAGFDRYYSFANTASGTVQYGEQAYLLNSGTATTSLVGSILRLEDSTAFGNTVRGFEVQAQRGTNTLGENTAISGFGRTFGVRGTTEGDAGAFFEPAGVFAQTRGTTQGNALRAYSGSITSNELVSFFHDTSAFTGTGLLMNFGNAGGSFSSTTSRFVDFQNAGTSKFVVTAHGTTTIGDGTTNNQAGLQIGYGGLCVDNDGSCSASTTGRISSVSTYAGNSDLAEMYFSGQNLVPGEIVMSDGFLSVKRATGEAGTQVLGVISTKPGLLLGYDDSSLTPAQAGFPLALSGRVPVRLSNENGPVAVGDALMLSSIPGVAMKATETAEIVGYALEAFDGERAYTPGFVDQFGDDLARPSFEALNENDDERINDGCYYGAGGATGEASEGCTPDESAIAAAERAKERAARRAQRAYENEQAALAALLAEPADSVMVEGEVVQIGQVIMFVDRGIHMAASQVDILNELSSTSTELVLGADEDDNETLWTRLKFIAQNFVDGVLEIAGIKTERVETSELCVDGVCINADDLRALLEDANRPSEGSGSGSPEEEPASEEDENPEGEDGGAEVEEPPVEESPTETPPAEEPPTEEESEPEEEAPIEPAPEEEPAPEPVTP